MSIYDFFFPEQAQASHLRSLVNQKRYEYDRDQRDKSDIKDELRYAQRRIEKMGNEMAETQLLVLLEKIKEIDVRDGVEDGRITSQGKRPKPKFQAKRNVKDL